MDVEVFRHDCNSRWEVQKKAENSLQGEKMCDRKVDLATYPESQRAVLVQTRVTCLNQFSSIPSGRKERVCVKF